LYQQSDWMRFRSAVVGAFAAFGIVLAIVGVWAVAAFSVVQRTREIGIRAALGALPWQVVASIVRQLVPALGAGAAAGVMAALGLSRFVQQWLFEIRATDPALLGAAASALIVLGVSAAVIPARRATQIDPAVTLRAE
jgi:ABC-type antimicrobial peptide transport system permease subunit